MRTLTYSEPCYIQNHGIFRTSEYSEPCQTTTMENFTKILTAIIIFANYNYFRKISFSCSLLYEVDIMNIFDTGLIFTPEYLFHEKSMGAEEIGSWGLRAVNFDIPLSINLLSSKSIFQSINPFNFLFPLNLFYNRYLM